MRQIIVASGNAGKFREIREILHDLPLQLTSLADHWSPVPDIPETGDTFLENARQKAAWVFARRGVWTLADDSGLEVDALGGEPGVKSARYAGAGAGSEANNRKLLAALKEVPPERRTARFRCVIVLMTAADSYFTAQGVCEGRIIGAPRGDHGFGYDPLFVADGFDRTFAELEAAEKNPVSHRGGALQVLRRHLDGLCA
jgi:XTP/dITP diphosphohydrolase